MVVCAMQRFTTTQQLADCNAMKFTQATNQVKKREPEILNNGNGAEDDREEGEIVDDFEMIISSEDEEFKLRARIQQLEDKSNDIEKMNMLSANLANQYSYHKPQATNRYIQHQHFSPISVLSDVSSLSDQDFDVAKKYRKHRMKRNDSRKIGQIYRRNPFANRTSHVQHGRKKRRHNNQFGHQTQMQVHQQPSTILLDTLDIVTEDEIYEYDMNVETENDEHEEQLKLSRNKLRVALARAGNDLKPKHSLRERLQCRIRKSPSPKRNQSNNHSQDKLRPKHVEVHSHYRCVKEEKDEQQQQREQQMSQIEDPQELKLRLIALKSAILKKHLARQKRDAERAYSPTDMINRVHQPTNNPECDDIDDLMEISPAASPERNTYSPPEVPSTEPVDMDLAQTDSDEEKPHTWQSTMATAGGSWRCFMPPSYPPASIPIVIDDEEELQQVEPKYKELYEVDDEVAPPPPASFHIQHMQLEDDDARDAAHLSDRNSQECCLSDIQSVSMDNSQTHTQSPPPLQHESSDDEAGALRAVLLSKRKHPANQQIKKSTLSTAQTDTVAHDSDDPEQLRQLLLSSIATKKKNAPERREILKQAVRRFQSSNMQSTEDNSLDSIERDLPVEPDQQTNETLQPLVPAPHSEPEPASFPLPVPESVPEPAQALQPKTDNDLVTAPMKPSSTPSTRIIKIVKPNKVINKKTALKRKVSKMVGQATAPKRPSTLLVKESVAPLHSQNSTSTTRLITNLDPASIKVKKLVIALADSSAGSDDELELRSSYNSYADNASPFSQAMDSASSSTTRSNTPNSEFVESTTSANSNLRRTVINDHFEKKLDDFLKQARSRVSTVAPTGVAASAAVTNPTENTVKQTEQRPKVNKAPAVNTPAVMATPVAVRHLPVASQREYLRLIERMRQLEKKRKATNGQATAAAKSCLVEKTNNNLPAKTKSAATEANNLDAKPTTAKGLMKATATSSAGNMPSTSTTEAIVQQASKETRLKAFESSFLKIGDSMIANLDKSLRMVDEAKRSKVERLRHTQRLKDLYAEMQLVKQAVKKEELKLARIQPEIQASHEIIISLKQKRVRLRNAAIDLGNGLHGADYRLLDPAKAEIARKSVELTKEIRLYNSIIKYEDICDLEASNKVAEGPATKPVPEPQPAYNPEPSEKSCGNSIQPEAADVEQAPPKQDEKQSLPSEKCYSSSVVPEDDVAPVGRQPDIDAVPQNAAIDDAGSSGLVHDDDQKPPPYTASFMRELSEEPVKPSLLGEYRTPMCRNYNSQLNVNATICPFELMGRCEDTDCSYMHLTHSARPEVAVPSASTSKDSVKTIQ